MSKFYTIQLASWRKAKEYADNLIDATVRSGLPLLAPTWDLLSRYKSNQISDNDYTEEYYGLLFDRYLDAQPMFDSLGKDGDFVIACYCGAGKFCHRHLLATFLVNNTDNEYAGEILADGSLTLEVPKVVNYRDWVRVNGMHGL